MKFYKGSVDQSVVCDLLLIILFGTNLSKGRRVIHSEQAQRKFQEVQEVLNASRLFSQVKRKVIYVNVLIWQGLHMM